MFAALVALREALFDIPCANSCKIGIEPNISPADYPMIRLVPVRIEPGAPYNQRTSEVVIYFGANITESEGLELVYQTLLDMEAEIIKVVKAQDGRYIETVTDEDRLDTYKLMFVRCEIMADRPAVS